MSHAWLLQISDKDVPILEHLIDVRTVFLADEAREEQHKEQNENPPPPGHEGEFADAEDDDLPKVCWSWLLACTPGQQWQKLRGRPPSQQKVQQRNVVV